MHDRKAMRADLALHYRDDDDDDSLSASIARTFTRMGVCTHMRDAFFVETIS